MLLNAFRNELTDDVDVFNFDWSVCLYDRCSY